MRNTHIYWSWLLGLGGILISSGLMAQSTEPLALVRQYTTTLGNIQSSMDLGLMNNMLNAQQEVWAVGYTEETLMVAQKISEVLSPKIKRVLQNERFEIKGKWDHFLPTLTEQADYQAYEAELLQQKQRLKELITATGEQSLVLFTNRSQAREGHAPNGMMALGNFLEVLGKSRDFKTRNIGMVSSSEGGLGGLTELFVTAKPGDAWLVDAIPLRNHVTAGHLNGDFLLLRSLVLRFDYLIFVHQTTASR